MKTVPTTIVETLNKTISDLCPFSIGQDNSENHCAHYVSHIMGYEKEGATCKNLTWADKQKSEKGAMIRINELFRLCANTGELSDKPAVLTECLIFVTIQSNMTKENNRLKMNDHRLKHIGILHQNKIWHYSNTQNKAVSDHLSFFITKFTQAYRSSGHPVVFYYGTLI